VGVHNGTLQKNSNVTKPYDMNCFKTYRSVMYLYVPRISHRRKTLREIPGLLFSSSSSEYCCPLMC
jgi:hypothetical protein